MNNTYIPLVKNTISNEEINDLALWLKTYPKLTKGEQTERFEEEFSSWTGCKYSLFVNSGSSANLAMFYALMLSGKMKNNKVVVPAVSWVTTVSPVIQLGLDPIICETSKSDLGLDLDYFETICKNHSPAAVIIVHVLGFPNDMNRLQEICRKYDVLLLEDSCESVGTLYNNKKTGTFGLMSSFSTYYGHHFSTIEGGLICTDDYDIYCILKSIRSHGWSRDLDFDKKEELQKKYNIDDFKNLYTFYYPGFNFRSTDLQAYLGRSQLKTLSSVCDERYKNFLIYDKNIYNSFWKIQAENFSYISNFAYPIISPFIKEITLKLKNNNIECRPLICGNIAKQPFFYERYGHTVLPFSDIIHNFGFYVPNNPDMTYEEIMRVCEIVNSFTANKSVKI